MTQLDQIPDLSSYAREWAGDLELLRQNWLLEASALVRFARDRGVASWGTASEEPIGLCAKGWLTSDSPLQAAPRLFHPFRFYPLHRVLHLCKLRVVPSPCRLHE